MTPKTRITSLTLGALGIVFGDIGTSPLYTLHECTSGDHGAAPTPENIEGVLSLIFWALTMVVSVKYLGFIMKADNQGEGGILALLALVPEKLRGDVRSKRIGWVPILVLIGAALLYGDGIITPAISVLSAVEGLEVATDKLTPLVLPLTCAILVGLFAIQRRGTGSVGRAFGPVMLVWFVTIGALGAFQIAKNPAILVALSPHHAAAFFGRHGLRGLGVLGGVVLAVTGGEALYADMGHFGHRPIRLAWWLVAMPALVLNYFGQGALMLRDPSALSSPFFSLVPAGHWTIALVILSGAATVIASQALISGAFSLTHQAVQLGYFPRVTVRHTSGEAEGQIYIPQINWFLMVACVALVLTFQKSARLAAAYGIAVTGTMAITSIVYYVVAHNTWGWSKVKAGSVVFVFLCFDIPFFAANLLKFFEGGYVPLLAGAVFFFLMLTWKRGRGLLADYVSKFTPSMSTFLEQIGSLPRVPGTGIYLASNQDRVPPPLFHHGDRMRVLPETVVLLTVVTEHSPTTIDPARQLETKDMGKGVYRVIARCGFMEKPNVPALVMKALRLLNITSQPNDLTYYLGRETFLATKRGNMGGFRESVFRFLSNNADPATLFFGIPPEQVVELGTQIDL